MAKGPSFKRKKKTKREKQAKGKRRGKVSRFKKPDPKGPVYFLTKIRNKKTHLLK